MMYSWVNGVIKTENFIFKIPTILIPYKNMISEAQITIETKSYKKGGIF